MSSLGPIVASAVLDAIAMVKETDTIAFSVYVEDIIDMIPDMKGHVAANTTYMVQLTAPDKMSLEQMEKIRLAIQRSLWQNNPKLYQSIILLPIYSSED